MAKNDSSKTQPTEEQVVHHRSARQKRGVEPAGMQLNLTSMIDIIFLLLIYFVITANFTPDEGVLTARVPAPEGEGPTAEELDIDDEELVIRLSPSTGTSVSISIAGGAASINGAEDLYQRLMALQLNETNTGGTYKDDNPVRIEPDKHVRWEHAADAFNAAIRARYLNVSFAQPKE